MAVDEAEVVAEAPKVKKVVPKQRSYFNSNKLNRVVLDDDLSYVEHKLIDEGTFEKFQDLTSAVKLDGASNTTEVDLALGKTRRFLLENCVCAWNLVDEAGNSLPFSYAKLLELPPETIGKIVTDIYEKNAILRAETESGKES